MKKRNKYEYEEEPAILPCRLNLCIGREDKLFVLLTALCGMPAASSYKIAYPTKASVASCSAMASKKLREPKIINAIDRLCEYHDMRRLTFNYKLISSAFSY